MTGERTPSLVPAAGVGLAAEAGLAEARAVHAGACAAAAAARQAEREDPEAGR